MVRRRTDFRRKTRAAEEILLSFFFPRRCPVCDGIVHPKGRNVCPKCREKVSFVKEPVCKKCGKEIRTPEAEYCPDCEAHRRSFDGGISLMNYDRIGRASMKAFKYRGRQEYAPFYIEEIVSRYGSRLRRFRADALIPVPMYWKKRLRRGYNQAEVLARELAKPCGLPVLAKSLVRSRPTRAQKELGAAQRRKNIEGSFCVKNLPEGVERVILVDDIYTTGSTAEACTRALMAAGVRHVLVVTVCIGKND